MPRQPGRGVGGQGLGAAWGRATCRQGQPPIRLPAGRQHSWGTARGTGLPLWLLLGRRGGHRSHQPGRHRSHRADPVGKGLGTSALLGLQPSGHTVSPTQCSGKGETAVSTCGGQEEKPRRHPAALRSDALAGDRSPRAQGKAPEVLGALPAPAAGELGSGGEGGRGAAAERRQQVKGLEVFTSKPAAAPGVLNRPGSGGAARAGREG